MRHKHLLKTAWNIILLDTHAIKHAYKEVTKIEIVWAFLGIAGLATFFGQLFATRNYLFAPEWWWFLYYALSTIVMIVFFIIFSYIIANQTINKVHWNHFFIPAALGAMITWITVIPYFTIVALWYVVVLFQIVKTMFQCTTEKAAIVTIGGVALSLVVYNLISFLLNWPSMHWYI